MLSALRLSASRASSLSSFSRRWCSTYPGSVLMLPTSTPILPGTTVAFTVPSHTATTIFEYQKNGGEYVGTFFMKSQNEVNSQGEEEKGNKTAKMITTEGEVHTKGSLCKINNIFTSYSKTTGFASQLVLSTTGRIELKKNESPHFNLNAQHRKISILPRIDQEFSKNCAEATVYRLEIHSNILRLVNFSDSYRQLLADMKKIDQEDLAALSDVGGTLVLCTPKEKQQLLEELDVIERAKKVLHLVQRDVEQLGTMSAQMLEQEKHAQRNHGGIPGQVALPKQNENQSPDSKKKRNEWQKVMADYPPPPHVKPIIDEEIEKFSLMQPTSSEYGTSRNYLDWLTGLPWGVASEDVFDLDVAKKILDENHFGMEDVKKRILEFIAVGAIKKKIESTSAGKILCLVGSPGVGKTSIGKSIAAALGRKFYRISVGGMRDVSEIKGHRRTYVGALPGNIIQALKKTKTFNPVIMIDEIEKMTRSRNTDPSAALLEVLDPEQNKEFSDHYLDVSVDLSRVLFICTGNSLNEIPEPLQDRMEVMEVPGYTTYEKEQIATAHLIPKLAKETSVPQEALQFGNGMLEQLIDEYCREPGVRTLQQKLESLYRQIAVRMVREEAKELEVTKDNMRELLGSPNFSIAEAFADSPPGVVVGLGYTSYGGNILILESVAHRVRGEGKANPIKLTGNLGDVLLESASIAQSYATALLKHKLPENNFYSENNISIHLPAGATQKEGPSAGIALVTALVSLATGKKVDSKLAMTGEVTLTGRVMAVGGIKEKLLGAQRSGIKRICLPEENRFDYEELDERLKAEFDEVRFFSRYEPLYSYLFEESAVQEKESSTESVSFSEPSQATARL